jgi:uncharacterized protein YkwD
VTAPTALLARAGLTALAIATPLVMSLPAQPASAVVTSGTDTAASNWITYSIQADRAWVHLPAMDVSSALNQVAYQHAAQMAGAHTLFDSPSLAAEAGWAVPGWTRLGENSGYGSDAGSVAWALVHSPSHLINILGNYNEVGVAAIRSGSTLWVAEVFAQRG